ncbi:MAG: hypothetical protein JST28_04905 [Acidobacteria bacterium]|nr:hypothetical protein [Acidobacteriota bacterium]
MSRPAKLHRVLLACCAGLLGVLVVYRFTQPVLFYIHSDCACTDWSDRVEAFAVLNPFRNRAPERAADGFLLDLREGRRSSYSTPELASDASQAKLRSLQWKLNFRENQSNRVTLYYKLDKNSPGAIPAYDSEGLIEVEKANGIWKAAKFDVVW